MRATVIVLGASVLADVAFGIAYGIVGHVGIWDGLYFATTTASTVGYGDITPHGAVQHLLAVAIMLTVIPLFSAVFSLLTTDLTKSHVDKRHDELKLKMDRQHSALKRHVEQTHYAPVECVYGGPDSSTSVDSQPDCGKRSTSPIDISGVPGHDQPADAPRNPWQPYS